VSSPERWLPVVGFEGLYMVSSLGRVRSLPRMVPVRGPGMRQAGGDILKMHGLSTEFDPGVPTEKKAEKA